MLLGTHLDLCGGSQEAGEITVPVIAFLTSLSQYFHFDMPHPSRGQSSAFLNLAACITTYVAALAGPTKDLCLLILLLPFKTHLPNWKQSSAVMARMFERQ